MNEYLQAMIAWAVMLSPYEKPQTEPLVLYSPHAVIQTMACVRGNCNILGFYNDEGIIYLSSVLKDDTSQEAASFLVHEIVHHLQREQGDFGNSCEDRLTREREAYVVQQAFLTQVGSTYTLTWRPRACLETNNKGALR